MGLLAIPASMDVKSESNPIVWKEEGEDNKLAHTQRAAFRAANLS
jgi:hypothetical protein